MSAPELCIVCVCCLPTFSEGGEKYFRKVFKTLAIHNELWLNNPYLPPGAVHFISLLGMISSSVQPWAKEKRGWVSDGLELLTR